MKLTPRRKKIFLAAALVLAAVILTGCAIPRDADNKIIYIWNEQVSGYTVRTSFSDVMKNENWFSAIFVYPLSAIINRLAPVLSVGGAIALVTIVVNAILAAATLKSSIAQQQMQLVQPELEKIQRKYEGRDDQASKMRQAQEMQALYQKYQINPGSMILVTFLQFPIIIAMYMAVQRSFAVATGTFLGMVIGTYLSLFFYMKVVNNDKWVKSLWVTAVITLFFYAVFVLWLKVPFPRGIFGI